MKASEPSKRSSTTRARVRLASSTPALFFFVFSERAKRARTSEYTEDVRELNEAEKSKKKYV